MRKTKVDHQTGLIGAHRKIRQTQKSPVCLPLTLDEAEAVMKHLRMRKNELETRRKLWYAQLVSLGDELGGVVDKEKTLDKKTKLRFSSFLFMLGQVIEGGQYPVRYTPEDAAGYFDYLIWMNEQIDAMFEMGKV